MPLFNFGHSKIRHRSRCCSLSGVELCLQTNKALFTRLVSHNFRSRPKKWPKQREHLSEMRKERGALNKLSHSRKLTETIRRGEGVKVRALLRKIDGRLNAIISLENFLKSSRPKRGISIMKSSFASFFPCGGGSRKQRIFHRRRAHYFKPRLSLLQAPTSKRKHQQFKHRKSTATMLEKRTAISVNNSNLHK